MQNFNIEEILKIAIKIEQNGRKFYLKAAEACPEHRTWLTRLADEEIAHENVFATFFKSFVNHTDEEPAFEDSENLAMTYLHSIADSIIFNLAKDPARSFRENPTIDGIIEDALRREHEAILFYTGLKSAMYDEKTAAEVDLIIKEEMSHVNWLKQKQMEIHDESLAKKERVYEVVIVGGGPGGISMAAELIEKGLDPEKMVVLESSPKTSWIIRKLYPEQKLVTANYKGASAECVGVMKMRNMTKESALQMLSEAVTDFGIDIHYDHAVLKIEKVDDLFHIQTKDKTLKAKYCVIAIGVFGKPNRPDYSIPRNLREKTSYDITSSSLENQDVLVVGGGDSASEYVQHLLKKGNRLILSSREKDLSYMNDDNRRITQTLGLSGKITLLAGTDVEGIKAEGSRIRVAFKDDQHDSILVDRIVYALGGTTPMNFLKISGIEMEGKQAILNEANESSVPGLYLTGDLAARASFGAIATAFNSSYTAAQDLAPKLGITVTT
ncbi:MAG: hypothetical protein CSA81_08715 [Acidobacteria bacterium]|nr:MAG: hypothetical protein CSA81_08715 [Acidobacteriota bacterium]